MFCGRKVFEKNIIGCLVWNRKFYFFACYRRNFIRKSCKINVKVTENQSFPAIILHFQADTILLSKFYSTTDVVRGFSVQIFLTSSLENESHKKLILRGFGVHFTSYSL
jgi:hypothetical protein